MLRALGAAAATSAVSRNPLLVEATRAYFRVMPPARPFSLRPLTDGERRLAREVFADALDPSQVRILAIPVWRRAFVAGPRLIVWPAPALPADFAQSPLAWQGAFVHELAHVWQAQRGVFLPLAKLRAGDGAAAYAYDLDASPAFAALNIEQQAMVVEHAFLAARGAAAPHPPEVYASLGAPWRRA
jgi:hypothetical protein